MQPSPQAPLHYHATFDLSRDLAGQLQHVVIRRSVATLVRRLLEPVTYSFARKWLVSISRNHVKVNVEDLLSRYTAVVPADVVALWFVFGIEKLFCLLQQREGRCPLVLGKVKDSLSVLFGNDDTRSNQYLVRRLQELAVFVLKYDQLSFTVFQAAERACHIRFLKTVAKALHRIMGREIIEQGVRLGVQTTHLEDGLFPQTP